MRLLVILLFCIASTSIAARSSPPKDNALPPDCVEVDLPRVLDLPQFKGEHKERLFWGTYRPQVYLGVRARTKQSLIAGLMWFGTAANGTKQLRHTCELSDDLRYGWIRHDGDKYGRQEIYDGDMKITTWFLKSRGKDSGYGGDWAVRVKVENNGTVVDNSNATLFFYVGDEANQELNMWPEGKNDGPFLSGKKREFGKWELHALSKDDPSLKSFKFNASNMANLSLLVQDELAGPTSRSGHHNVAALRITGKQPLQLDFVFVSGKSRVDSRVANISGDNLTEHLVSYENAFEERFERTFQLSTKLSKDEQNRSLEVAKAAFSNLIGGIGYFYGSSEVALSLQDQKRYNASFAWCKPASLYTAVPSRPVFPRGFLWDEGFHQLIISKWDRNISYDILGHWLDLMNHNGWIPREQILGAEARSKVPAIYYQQHSDNGNPPTFFFVYQNLIEDYIKNAGKNDTQVDFDRAFLERSFPRLSLWYNWFNTSQLGRVPGSYYWHGREITDTVLNVQTLSSGLDDYPRASHPSADERHLDMRCWMAFASRALSLISDAIGKPSEAYNFTADKLLHMEQLNELHYDAASGRYYDYGNHTEQCEMVDRRVVSDGKFTTIEHRVCQTPPSLQYVPHFGFVSLFPFITKILPPESPILGDYLKFIRDENLLWSGFGLRSLAKTSSMYNRNNSHTSPPYWRGTVWINFNYLSLAALKHYSSVPGPYNETAATVYEELRQDVIKNMVEQYYTSGFIWEQYDNTRNGVGKGAHPFTGWSALLMLMMAESY